MVVQITFLITSIGVIPNDWYILTGRNFLLLLVSISREERGNGGRGEGGGRGGICIV